MNTAVKIDKIIKQISTLDNNSKIQVVEKILTMLKSKKNLKTGKVKLTDLKGFGADLWQNQDVDTFLKNEREWD